LTLTSLLANSLEYPERIQRGLEWTQFLKRLIVCSLSVSKLANSLEYPVEDPERNRVDSVFETSVLCLLVS